MAPITSFALRRPLLAVISIAIVAAFGSFGLARAALPIGQRSDGRPNPSRIVSLAPAITETLFAIGAGDRVVGVSDYCNDPPEVARLCRVGTSITPSFERIARLEPTLIVTEKNASSRGHELDRLAPTVALNWLTLDQIVTGIRELGRLSGHPVEADSLADRMHARLAVPPPSNGPRVLLVLGYDTEKLDEIWFIRKNSVHGAALHAAGARNAVDADVTGLPRLSLSRVVEIDPDLIIVLIPKAGRARNPVESFSSLGVLKAVKMRRVGVIEAPEAFANGPRILGLVDRLAAQIKRLAGGSNDIGLGRQP